MKHGSFALSSILLLAMAPPVPGQFTQLTATDDGKQVYFVSELLLRGRDPTSFSPETRLYRSGPEGVTLFAERGALAPENHFSSGDGVSSPQVTADGKTVGFTLQNICDGSPDCSSGIAAESMLRGGKDLDLGPGILQLSRNGRWAVLMETSSSENSVLIDLTTGLRVSVPPPPGSVSMTPAFRTVASDGTVLVVQRGQIGLWKDGQFTALGFDADALSDDASTVVSSGVEFGAGFSFIGARVIARRVASKKEVVLFESTDRTVSPEFLGMSNNGNLVLFAVGSSTPFTGQAYIGSTETGRSCRSGCRRGSWQRVGP